MLLLTGPVLLVGLIVDDSTLSLSLSDVVDSEEPSHHTDSPFIKESAIANHLVVLLREPS